MSSYTESVQFLYGLQKFGMKFGLVGVRRLLKALGNPQRAFRSLHIAGTNGKGSTASMLAAILTAAGYKTGLYTSPHLVSLTERIRVNGKEIPTKSIEVLTSKLKRTIEKERSTFFEATTAMAFAHFAEVGVDVAVVETGLGGRLDSTNVLRPFLSVITSVGLDHTEILGDTIGKIAFEKAGIVKPGVPCVTGAEGEALRVIKRICRERRAKLATLSGYTLKVRKASLDGTLIDAETPQGRIDGLFLSLPGFFQLKNVGLVLAAVREMSRSAGIDVEEEAIRRGLGSVQVWTGLSGRMQLVRKEPPVLLDVAHNPEGTAALVDSLQRMKLGSLIVVFGVMKEKDHRSMVRLLSPLVREAIVVAAVGDRSRPASDLAVEFDRSGVRVRAALSVREGVRFALERASKRTPVLVTGSHYVVGEAIVALQGKKPLDND